MPPKVSKPYILPEVPGLKAMVCHRYGGRIETDWKNPEMAGTFPWGARFYLMLVLWF
jgi:hypothetical protein